MACVIYRERSQNKKKISNQDETYAGDSRPSENVEHSIRYTHHCLSLVTFSLFFFFSLPRSLHLVEDYFTKTHIHTEVKTGVQKPMKKISRGVWESLKNTK